MRIPGITNEKYNELISLSSVNYGNYSRIKKAVEKSQTGRVTIAFLGSSVTVGYTPEMMIIDNFPANFCKYFSEQYSKAGDCICINKGLASATSILGLATAENSIRTAQPDIIFVEFAITNGTDKIYITSFESLVYKLLCFENSPAVIPIIVCNSDFYSCASYMEMVAKHYDLPVVNINNLLKTGIENNLIQWSNYSDDYGHPSESGHELIADCMKRLFELSDNRKDNIYEIPEEACFSRELSTFQFIDHDKLLSEDNGSFLPCDTILVYPKGWSYKKNTGNKSFHINMKCKKLFILYEQSNSMDYGEIEITDNGNMILMIDGYSIYGWNNPDIKTVVNDTEVRIHQIEIKIQKGDENKKFSILGFGVVNGSTQP